MRTKIKKLMKFNMTRIHIGRLIQEKAETESYSAHRLAERLHCDRSNVYKIYRKQTIDTELLLQISKVFNYDFFRHYSDTFYQLQSK
jgi:plasmid maintenance system antidote protein VapI